MTQCAEEGKICKKPERDLEIGRKRKRSRS
jgi:hypothetical protein